MIVKRMWGKQKGNIVYVWEGWFLFGILPLYIRVINMY